MHVPEPVLTLCLNPATELQLEYTGETTQCITVDEQNLVPGPERTRHLHVSSFRMFCIFYQCNSTIRNTNCKLLHC